MRGVGVSGLTGPSARSAVAPFYVMQLFQEAESRRALGLPVYNLAIGQPGTPAPAVVREAARQALSEHRLGYTGALGLPQLREAIAEHTRAWYGVDVPPANVVVTTGSSGGFLAAFLAAFNAGDVVAMPRPGYPAYRNILASLGCVVQEFECGPDQGYTPTLAMLQALDPTPAGLILGSPANPTGAMVAPDRIAEIAAWCRASGVRLVSDEIYHGISYAGPGANAWQFDRSSIVVNSFSKYFSMTGWRVGWLLAPDELLDAVDRLVANFTICPPTLSQLAALAAFDAHAELEANVARYAENRALLLQALPAIGLDRLAPADGAFYVYADVSDYTDNSLVWVRHVLAETGVALAPGLDFDAVEGRRFARLSFAGDLVEIEQAVTVLGKYLQAGG
ncbi:aminotransferase class I/II-fold pyridoxal phosphate-dependent enzyme [Jatrophihabitans sp.]|uniref:aminotransferase class I/II-fold pyridoxal phosphate-dependent enzyme n=1 Tax=Jatrophihabitans sp. TaxID=1932789 RepID=UPI0038CDAC9C